METFHYEASTKDGSIVSGTLEVASERAAVDRIQDMGYFPLKINKAGAGSNTISRFITSITSRVVDKERPWPAGPPDHGALDDPPSVP